MRELLGLIIFWLSVFGLSKFLEKKFQIPKHFSLPYVFTLIIIITFIGGILNILRLTSCLLTLLGLSYLIKLIVTKEITKNSFSRKSDTIIILVIYLIITILGFNMHLVHYDNFSHWGLIVKNMLLDNRLPNFLNTSITFQGYQPGSACFLYFFGLLTSKRESMMIIASNYLLFSYISVLFSYVKNNHKLLKRILLIFFYLLTLTISIRFNDLLVDLLLPVIALFAILVINFYKKDLKIATLYSLPIFVELYLIKNAGLVFTIYLIGYLLYLAFKEKSLKVNYKYFLLIIFTLLFSFLIWQRHVSLVYQPFEAHYAKHSLTLYNLVASFRQKGPLNILIFIKMYFLNFFNLKENMANIYMLIINFLVLFKILVTKSKNEVKFLIIINLIYISYYFLLGLMYIFSMPLNEALELAGYFRYMSSILIFILGMVIFKFINLNIKTPAYKILLCLVIFLEVIGIYYKRENIAFLIFNDYYKGSIVEDVDLILEKIPKDNELTYYIYAKNADNYGYLFNVFKYKLNTKKILIIHDKSELPENLNGYLVLFSNDDLILNSISKDSLEKINDLVFKVNEKV